MKQLLSFTLVMLFAGLAWAQNFRIVKDNINCSYGLKDKNGAWVLEPIYTLIQEYNSGYYLVKDPMGDGILTPTGKWLLECKYDQIDTQLAKWNLLYEDRYGSNITRISGKGFFLLGVKGEEKFLINSQGKTIRKMTLNAKFGREDNAHFMIYEEGPARTTYMDTSGTVFIDRMEGTLLPFVGGDYSLRCTSFQDYGKVASGNVQLVNKYGKVQLDDIFEMAILISNNRICFQKNGKHGMMKTNGEIIIPTDYQWEIGLMNPDSYPNGWVVKGSNGKKGVIRGGGRRVVAPVYDQVNNTNRNQNQQLGWMIEEGTKKGVVDLEGNFLVPLEYDQIARFHYFNQKRALEMGFVVMKGSLGGIIRPSMAKSPSKFYDKIQLISDYDYSFAESIGNGFVVEEDGKFGILNIDEGVMSASVYDSYQRRGTSDQHYWFFKGHELVEFAFKRSGIEQRNWTLFIELEDQLIFELGNQYVIAQLSGDGSQIVSVLREGNEFTRYGNMLVMNPRDPKQKVIYNTVTKKRIDWQNITHLEYASKSRFVIRTRSNNAGLVDENGTILLDTLYNVIQVQEDGNFLWGSRLQEDGRYVWTLMNGDGEQLVPTLFSQSFKVNSGDQLVSEKSGTGLLDTETFKWKIKPNYGCLYRKTDRFYESISHENKKGILRSDGTYLIQPIYDTIILLAGNCYVNGFLAADQPADFYWVAQLGTKKTLFHQAGESVRVVQNLNSFKKSLFFEDTLLMTTQNAIRNFPTLDYSPSLHFLRGLTPEQVRKKKWNLWSNSRIKTTIFDTINAVWEARKVSCGNGYYSWITVESTNKREEQLHKMCQCAQMNQSYYGNNYTYKLMSIGSKFATLSQDYPSNNRIEWYVQSSMPPMGSPPSNYWNFVERNGVVKSIQLKDIFPNDETLMGEFIEALQERDDLKLECSSVENMLEMINGKFGLTDEGVSLYLNQNHNNFYGNYMPVELYIPLENLEKHAESKWIVPILKAK